MLLHQKQSKLHEANPLGERKMQKAFNAVRPFYDRAHPSVRAYADTLYCAWKRTGEILGYKNSECEALKRQIERLSDDTVKRLHPKDLSIIINALRKARIKEL